MIVLSSEQLKEEMESGSCSDNVFSYQGKEYYFGHSFDDNTYHFGVANTTDTDQKFQSFDEIMNAVIIGNKPFKDMLLLVKWY